VIGIWEIYDLSVKKSRMKTVLQKIGSMINKPVNFIQTSIKKLVTLIEK